MKESNIPMIKSYSLLLAVCAQVAAGVASAKYAVVTIPILAL